MKKQLTIGRAISVFAKLESDEIIMHDDVSAWGAPSECHADVSRGYEKRYLEAELEAGFTEKELKKICEDRGLNYQRCFEGALGRIHTRDNPFN